MLGHVTYNILDLIVRRVRSARLRSIQEEQQQALDSSSLTRDNVQEETPSSSYQHHHKPKVFQRSGKWWSIEIYKLIVLAGLFFAFC